MRTNGDGSLILGTRSRLFPNLLVEADSGPLQDSKLWFRLGRVRFSSFVGLLDRPRNDIDNPRLIGMRLVLQPWPQLQLGDQPGNQLGGFDLRWDLSSLLPGLSVYGQRGPIWGRPACSGAAT